MLAKKSGLNRNWLFSFVAWFTLATSQSEVIAAPARGLRLQDAYEAALIKNESVGIQESRVLQADERVSQAQSGLLPRLSFSAGFTHQDPSGSTATATRAFTDPNQTQARITANQTIFRGFSEFAALRAANSLNQSQKYQVEQTRLSLFSDVAQAYFGVLIAEQDLENLKSLSGVTIKRINELRQRSKIGRSRQAEVLTTEAQSASLKGQVEAAEAALILAREQFAYMTGLDASAPLSREDSTLPKEIESLEVFLKRSELRPDLLSLSEQQKAVEESVTIARGGHFPTLDAFGNYYLKRSGVLKDSKWDVGLNLNLPIFSGGLVQSQVREASSRAREVDLQLAQSRRNVVREVRSLYESAQSNLKQIESFSHAFEISEKHYREQNKDYSYGLATNLEVIQSLNLLYEVKRTLDRARLQAKSSIATLHAAAGQLPQGRAK